MNNSLKLKGRLILLSVLFSAQASFCQEMTYPIKEDVATISGILTAAYDAISGAAGTPRPVERIASLYVPKGLVSKNTITDGKNDREVMTINQFQQKFPVIRKSAFYEEEINREIRIFGNIASVWSTYQIRYAKNGPPVHRGINSIQLHYKEDRWWIVSWSWDAESGENPIPASFDAY